MTTTGRPPKPTELKRRVGNPGKRALPTPATVHALPPVDTTPDPPRPLGPAGRALWERAWQHGRAWIAESDIELLLLTCEQIDERQALRLRVLRDNDWRERSGLRALDKVIQDGLGMMGFSPVDRSRLGVAEVKVVSALEEVRRRRTANATSA
jgi:hypothetical protein